MMMDVDIAAFLHTRLRRLISAVFPNLSLCSVSFFDSSHLPRTHSVCVSVVVVISLCLDIRVELSNSWG